MLLFLAAVWPAAVGQPGHLNADELAVRANARLVLAVAIPIAVIGASREFWGWGVELRKARADLPSFWAWDEGAAAPVDGGGGAAAAVDGAGVAPVASAAAPFGGELGTYCETHGLPIDLGGWDRDELAGVSADDLAALGLEPVAALRLSAKIRGLLLRDAEAPAPAPAIAAAARTPLREAPRGAPHAAFPGGDEGDDVLSYEDYLSGPARG